MGKTKYRYLTLILLYLQLKSCQGRKKKQKLYFTKELARKTDKYDTEIEYFL